MKEQKLSPLERLDELLAELSEVQTIAESEMDTAPALTDAIEKEQVATYEGKSDHSSVVEVLAKSEEQREGLEQQIERLAFDNDQLRFNERYDLHELRRKYTPHLFRMVVGWLVFVGIIVAASAIGWSKLTDAVLIALITTTTANVIGMFVIAARWLFPTKPKK